MTNVHFMRRWGARRRAVVAVQVAITMVVLLGFAVLTVDVGQLFGARTELQRAADSAALAGASAFVSDDMMRMRVGTGTADTLGAVLAAVELRADTFSNMNDTLGLSTAVDTGDIVPGFLNVYSATEPIQPNPAAAMYNGVHVMVRRESGGAEGSNGPVPFYFAGIFGKFSGNATASATAVFDDRFAGYKVTPSAGNILPFTIHEDAFNQELAFGGDNYAWHEDSGAVSSSTDGIREVRLYPYPLSGSGYSEGDGNFGVLNIGTGNQGVTAEAYQIENGVSATDFEMEIGTSDVEFYTDSGSAVSYDMTGSPGLEATLKAAIEPLVGEVVGFFLHDNVVLSGSNATYTIVALRFGRVMDIRLTGPPNKRGFYIQPVSYNGGGVRIDKDAPSSGGLVGRIVLAR